MTDGPGEEAPDGGDDPLAPPPTGIERSVGAVRRGARRTVSALRQVVGTVTSEESLPAVPLTETDAAGRTVTYRPYDPADRADLVAMYDDFDPADRAQGTPPAGEAAIRDWLDHVLAGVSVVAVDRDAPSRHDDDAPSRHDDDAPSRQDDSVGRVVGHAMFVPDDTGRHEFAIFVDADYRGAGVGTTLARAGMGHASEEGVGYVWLSVESSKRGLQSWYGTLGFSTVNPMGMAHRMSRVL